MKKAVIKKNGTVITGNAEVADSFFRRFMGLMFRKSIPSDYALHIIPCNQIHMLNMRFAIDVIYLDKSGKVVKIESDVKPNKICKTVKNAASVIEMNSLCARRLGLCEGDIIEIQTLQ